jgi:hypothetical protein
MSEKIVVIDDGTEDLTEKKVRALNKKALFESALRLKEGLGTVAKEGMTVVGLMTAAAAPSVGAIVGSVGYAGHRVMSKLFPRATHPDIYKELDELKGRLDILESKEDV